MFEEPKMHIFPHGLSTEDHLLMEKLQRGVLEHLTAMQAIVEKTLKTKIEGQLKVSLLVGEKWAGPLPRKPVEMCSFIFGGSVTERHGGGFWYSEGVCWGPDDAAP